MRSLSAAMSPSAMPIDQSTDHGTCSRARPQLTHNYGPAAMSQEPSVSVDDPFYLHRFPGKADA